MGDIDGDGTPEVLAGSDNAHVHAWHADGSRVSGWPQRTSASFYHKGTKASWLRAFVVK